MSTEWEGRNNSNGDKQSVTRWGS